MHDYKVSYLCLCEWEVLLISDAPTTGGGGNYASQNKWKGVKGSRKELIEQPFIVMHKCTLSTQYKKKFNLSYRKIVYSNL